MKYKFVLEVDVSDENMQKLCEGTVGDWIYESISDSYEEIYNWVPGDDTILLEEISTSTDKLKDEIANSIKYYKQMQDSGCLEVDIPSVIDELKELLAIEQLLDKKNRQKKGNNMDVRYRIFDWKDGYFAFEKQVFDGMRWKRNGQSKCLTKIECDDIISEKNLTEVESGIYQ